MKIGFLGAGHLGRAMIQGLLNSTKYQKQDFLLVVASEVSLTTYQKDGFQVSQDWSSLVDCEVVILALRPDVIKKYQQKLQQTFKKEQVLISVAAGLTIEQLQTLFPNGKVAIAMPNTACQFNQALTMVVAESHEQAKQSALALFNLLGATIILPATKIHTFIAICGSASAYLYYWLQPLMAMAVADQISVADSKQILTGLLNGVAANLVHSSVSLQQLQEQVTVPGGTTIEAIKVFDEYQMQDVIEKAIAAVAKRSEDLG